MQLGDTLKVTKLDRIARSATQGIELIQSLLDKEVTVHVLNMGIGLISNNSFGVHSRTAHSFSIVSKWIELVASSISLLKFL